MKEKFQSFAKRLLPVSVRRKIVRSSCWPPVGMVRFGSLRRLKPISTEWGSERGRPIDRYYIEQFMGGNADDIHGHVLEIGANKYTRSFGDERVMKSDVLHIAEKRPGVTVIGDLTKADHIPSNSFDCLILTQTLQVIFDVSAAVRTVYRILKPSGVVLASVPGISKISRYDMDRWGYYWSFTSRSMERLFETAFPAENIQINAYGNVLTATAFLHGVAAEELEQHELNYIDPDFELIITVRAIKDEAGK